MRYVWLAVLVAVVLGVVLVPGSPGAAKKLRPDVSDELRSDFGIFRQKYTVRPALTERIARIVLDDKADATEAGGRLASFVTTTTASGAEVRVVPGRDRICLGTSDGGLSCLEPRHVRAGLLTLGSLCKPTLPAGKARIVGIVPDGVRRVFAVTAGGGRLATDVESNTYTFETTAQVRRVTWRSGGFDVGLPDPASVECAPPGGDRGDRAKLGARGR